MSLYWLDTTVVVRRQRYANDKSSLATMFTNIPSSVQTDTVPVGFGSGGFASRAYTVFMDTRATIKNEDRLVCTDGRELRVIGVKLVTSGFEPYQQIACEEAQD